MEPKKRPEGVLYENNTLHLILRMRYFYYNFFSGVSVWININTNEYFFPILYTCIYYNSPMNPVKFCQDQIQNGRLIAFLFAQIDKIFENVVRPNEYLQHQ